MKITFQKSEHTQQPVQEAQVTMREARSKKTPVLKVLGTVAVVAALTLAGFLFFRGSKVYTYGIISGQIQEIRPPVAGKIAGLTLRRGDFVKKGDLLCAVSSQESAQEHAALGKLREELLARKMSTDQGDHLSVQKAQIEVKKLADLYESRKKIYEKQKELHRMDAAVLSSVEAAKNAMQLASHNLEQAKVDLHKALGTEKQSALPEAELDVAIARAEPKKTEFHAGFDGVVMEVREVEGNLVAAQGLILTVADISSVWLDLYVPPQNAAVVSKGRPVTAYLPGESAGVLCTMGEDKGVVVRTPELLLEKMPHTNTTIYTRAAFAEPNAKVLLPGTIVRAVIPY